MILPTTLIAFAIFATSTAGSGVEDAAGLTAIQPAQISADLHFLASDALKGRDTPSPQLRVAARYLRSRVARLGFVPGGEDGGFFDTYPLTQKRMDTVTSHVILGEGEDAPKLAFGEDYFLLSSSSLFDLDVSGDVVYCGAGGKEDFAQHAQKGAWGLVYDDGSSATRRRRYAERAELVGLIVVPDPSTGELPVKTSTRMERTVQIMLRGTSHPPRAAASSKSRFPTLIFSAAGAGKLFEALPGKGQAEWAQMPGQALGLKVTEVRRAEHEVRVENVCALWPGSDPKLAQEVIILSAHYDHVGTRGGEIYNGADDNGSGTSGLLAIADALAAQGPLRRTVLLIWVSGEEKGLWGSAAWAKEPTLPEGMRALCNFNIDMIGRNAPEELYITPSQDHERYNALVRIAREQGPHEGFTDIGSADQYYHRSDQKMFAEHLDIPVAFLFNGEHEDYHKPSDTPDKIDYEKLSRVARLLFRVVLELQGDDLVLE